MKELTEFLEKYPHLIPIQLEIDRNLRSLDTNSDRMYYLCVEMSAKADELVDAIRELHRRVG